MKLHVFQSLLPAENSPGREKAERISMHAIAPNLLNKTLSINARG